MPPERRASFRVTAWTPRLRLACAALIVFATLNLLELALRLAADALSPEELGRAPLPLLVRRIFWLTVLPWLCSRVLGHLNAAAVDVDAAALPAAEAANGEGAVTSSAALLTLVTRAARIEVPLASIASIEPWKVALPRPGISLRLGSGRQFESGLALADPRSLVEPLAAAAGLPVALANHPALLDAAARRKLRFLSHPALILGAIPAIVTFILFRLHQLIMYGGLFGELYLHGWRRWLGTLAGVFLFAECHLLVFAAALRVLIESLALLSRTLLPDRIGVIRSVLEIAAAVGYCGGVALFLALRLLS